MLLFVKDSVKVQVACLVTEGDCIGRDSAALNGVGQREDRVGRRAVLLEWGNVDWTRDLIARGGAEEVGWEDWMR